METKTNPRSKYKLPKHLIGKTIGVIGSFPGVGKTYVKNDWAQSLRNAGYKVKNLGTTQKASVDGTVAAYSFSKKIDWSVNGYHGKTNAFYFIDEAWMFTQEVIDELKKNYPLCCFVLFGDPLQFEPVCDGKPITKLDYCINLETPYRFKDEELFEAIKQIKAGIVPIDFMMKHAVDNPDPINEITITYEKKTRDFI